MEPDIVEVWADQIDDLTFGYYLVGANVEWHGPNDRVLYVGSGPHKTLEDALGNPEDWGHLDRIIYVGGGSVVIPVRDLAIERVHDA